MEKFIHISYIVAVTIVTFGLAVFVHEFGHMIFALMRGVGVESFAIGMGPKITAWKWRGIEFSLRWLPIGGFVKLHGMAPEEEMIHVPEKKEGPDGEEERKTVTESSYDDLYALRDKGLVTKLMVFGGGVFMNFITAIVATAVLLMIPRQEPRYLPIVETVAEGEAAATAGLAPGDVVVAAAGQPVEYTNDFYKAIGEATGQKAAELPVVVKRGGEQVTLQLDVPHSPEKSLPALLQSFFQEEPRNLLGLDFQIPPLVGQVSPAAPAHKAGFEDGDRILAVNGTPIDSFQDMQALVNGSGGKELTFDIARGDEQVEISLVPLKHPLEDGKWIIGISNGFMFEERGEGMNPLRALVIAPVATVAQGQRLLQMQVDFFKRATLKDVSDNLGGPVMIAAMTANAAKHGVPDLIGWFVTFNLLLMMFNLLPIPVLDGGFILISIIEAVIRRPVPPKVLNPIYTVFVVFFIGLMLLITVWDVKRFFF